MRKSYYVFLIILFLFIIFIITFVRKNKKNDPEEKLSTVLFDTSLFFDKIYNILKPKSCQLSKEAFQPFRKTATKLLTKIYNTGYYRSKLIIMNPEVCLHFNLLKDIEICKNSNIKLCTLCTDIWRQINSEAGFRLKNNLVQTYDQNGDLFLYKTYKCNNRIFLVGISLIV